MTENYKLLGLDESATDEEITARYEELKAKYSEDRWLDGEAGNEAARLLTKINVAYQEIMSERKESKKNTEGKNSFEEIAALLKQDKLAEAQDMLDAFNERNAEWHYMQAVVYYKKNWTNDSKKQLEIAMQMDPDNVKYRNAYGKMNIGDSFFLSHNSFELRVGVGYIREMIENPEYSELTPEELSAKINARSAADVEAFKARRKPYLLYSE